MRRRWLTGKQARWAVLVTVLVVTGVLSATLARAGASSGDCAQGMQAVGLDVALRGEGKAVCLPIAGAGDDASRVDVRYGDAAAVVVADQPDMVAARQDASVAVCWNRDDWKAIGELFAAQGRETIRVAFGFVSHSHNVINLSPPVCAALDAMVYEGERAENRVVSNAVRTLIHEAIHAAGIVPEGEVECYANQLTSQTAAELGMDAVYGATLTSLNWEMNRESRAGSVYDSPDCHQQGPFDLGLGAEVWN